MIKGIAELSCDFACMCWVTFGVKARLFAATFASYCSR